MTRGSRRETVYLLSVLCISDLPGTLLYSPKANCGCFNEVFVLVDERISEANLDTQIECLNCVICY